MTTRKIIKLQTLLTEAHQQYWERLSSYAYFKVKNRVISEDLVQNTFMKTWMYLRRGKKIERMKIFLYHVLNNLITDEYRKRKTVSLDGLLERGIELNVVDSNNLSNVFDAKLAVGMIKHLPPAYQNVVSMRYLEDLSSNEMSIMTGLSKNTIAVKLHRGIQKLKNLYNY